MVVELPEDHILVAVYFREVKLGLILCFLSKATDADKHRNGCR